MTRRLPALALLMALQAPVWAGDLAACPQTAGGRKVRVALESGAVLSGAILSASSDSIVLRAHGEPQTIPATAIERIEVRSGGKTVRNILLGAAAGAGIGVLFGASYDEADSDSLAILFGLIGAGGGAGVGTLLPARRLVCGSDARDSASLTPSAAQARAPSEKARRPSPHPVGAEPRPAELVDVPVELSDGRPSDPRRRKGSQL